MSTQKTSFNLPSVFLIDKAPYLIFFLILYAALSVFIQTFTKTPFLPGGRGSIEYLHITGCAESFGYSRLYTMSTLLAIALNALLGEMISAVKSSIIVILALYFIALYTLSSTFSGKWSALTVVLTSFLYPISDTVFKGDYTLLTALTFTTYFIAGIVNFLRKPSRKSLAVATIALALIPFSDPQLLLPLSVVVYTTILACAILSSKRLLPHYIMLASTYSGTTTFSISVFAGLNDRLWQVNPLTQLSSNIIISATLLAASALGMLSLYRRGYHKILYIMLVWLISSILFSVLDYRLISLTIPVLSALAPASLSYMKDAVKVMRGEGAVDDDFQYEIEVNLGKLSASLPAVLLIILLLLAIPSMMVLGDHEIVPPPRVEDIHSASDFLSKNAGRELIVAHPSLANWLLSSSSLNVLPIIDDKTFKTADLLTTTSFRIVNSFIKVDDWEPFSASKAPLIHVYDGKNFRPIAYIDDSYSRFTLVDSEGRKFIESPYMAKFLSYNWNESSEQIALTMSFKTPGLMVNKVLTMSKYEPKVSVEYYASTAKRGVSLKGFSLNVYSLPMDILPGLEVIGNEVKMDVEGCKLKINFYGKIENISQDRTKDQRYVTCNFIPLNDGTAYGKVVVEALNPEPSKEKPYYSSFFDEARRYGVKYVIVPKEHQVFMQEAVTHKIGGLIIKDSFVRFILNSWGNIFQEAPAYAEVLNETVHENSRIVSYKTAGLYIDKDVHVLGNSLNVTYAAQPYKNRTFLIMSTLSIWIDYARTIVSYNIHLRDKIVELTLDSGRFKVHFIGNVTDIKVEPHPEYGQTRIIATFQLHHKGDKIGFMIESDKKAIIQYNPTTRPTMKDNDEIFFFTEGGVFKPVKELKLYTIYHIMP